MLEMLLFEAFWFSVLEIFVIFEFIVVFASFVSFELSEILEEFEFDDTFVLSVTVGSSESSCLGFPL